MQFSSVQIQLAGTSTGILDISQAIDVTHWTASCTSAIAVVDVTQPVLERERLLRQTLGCLCDLLARADLRADVHAKLRGD